jgi:hypothetical protein
MELCEESKTQYENQAVLFSNEEKGPLMVKPTPIVKPVRRNPLITDYLSIPVTP